MEQMSSCKFSYLGVRIAIPSNVATAVSEEPPPSIWTDIACHSIYKGETFHIFTICTMYAYVFVILFLQATSPELKSVMTTMESRQDVATVLRLCK